jgi:hypothetical protein
LGESAVGFWDVLGMDCTRLITTACN